MSFSSFLRQFARGINKHEKGLLALLSVVIVISGTFWLREFSTSESNNPSVGGTYIEGIVGSSTDVETIAARITKVGLFKFNRDGELENVLVESWNVNQNKTQYTFKLKSEVDVQEIKTDIDANYEVFGQIESEVKDSTLILNSTDPSPNIPLILAQPLFDYGAYKLNKTTDSTTILTRNNRSGALGAFINKIIIHNYQSKEELQLAIDRKKVDGTSNNLELNYPPNFIKKEIALPQYYALVFNVNKAPFKSLDYRRQAFTNSFSKKIPFTLTVTDQVNQIELAEQLIKDWAKAGVNVKLNKQSIEDIQTSIAPSRNFEAMITGISYGYELDPYYLWHSSQVLPPGNNFSGINNTDINIRIEKIRNTYNVISRYAQIDELHKQLGGLGVLKILDRSKEIFAVSDAIRFVPPTVAVSPIDHWYALSEWSVK
ncbi:hypothetical protein HY844_01805 [Candidatus Berkelbacteria bacterium]|nr:hypothetical protein [Candidatus Berkelbacteria bacterium]